MLKPAVSLACLGAATMAMAEPTRMTGSQITELVVGATVELDAPLGNKLPLRYGADGQVKGEARDLAAFLGSASDTGRWWVAQDQLCHKWSRWFSGETQCLKLRKEGQRIHWVSRDGNSGTATITVPGPGRTVVAAVSAPRTQPEGIMRLSAAQSQSPSQHQTHAQPLAQSASSDAAPPPLPAAPKPRGAEAPKLADPAAAPQPVIISAAPDPDPPPMAPVAKPAPAVKAKPVAAPARIETASAPKPAAALFMVANVRRDDVLNIRSGPSADHDVVAGLAPGSRGVAITGECRAVWCPVQHAAGIGWVNRSFLVSEAAAAGPLAGTPDALSGRAPEIGVGDSPEAPRSCLSPAARALLARIEEKFGRVRTISTCRPGATIAGTGRTSRHASGNAVDFDAGGRKAEVVAWLVANHRQGGTMTYRGMDHIHVDIGPHFVSIAGGEHWASWRQNRGERDRGG